jgi:hypothetical protein
MIKRRRKIRWGMENKEKVKRQEGTRTKKM